MELVHVLFSKDKYGVFVLDMLSLIIKKKKVFIKIKGI